MPKPRALPMPRIVNIASILIGAAAVLCAVIALGAGFARTQAAKAAATLAEAAGSDGRDLAATVHSSLQSDVVIGVACSVMLAVVAIWARRPAGRARMIAWGVSFVALIAISFGVGEDPSSAVSAGGFTNPHLQQIANRLIPGWYPWIVQLSELGAMAALVAVLVMLLRSGSHDYYRQGRLGDETGLWSFVERENQSRNG